MARLRLRPFLSCARAAILAGLLTAFLMAFSALAGCDQSVYPDREPAVVEGIRVDSLRFLPRGTRFVLADSATQVRFVRFHPGYACTQVLTMTLARTDTGAVPTFFPSTKVRLPAAPDCPVDSGGRDSLIAHVFGAGTGAVRLANSSGAITDSAIVARGSMAFDTLNGVKGIAGTVSKGRWTLRDSSVLAPRLLFADSLSSCEFLNQADYANKGDTVTVRLSWVTLDAAVSPDSCRGPAHADSVPAPRAPADTAKK
jgi:hypothetical protein